MLGKSAIENTHLVNYLKVSTRVISSSNMLHEVEGSWNSFINKCSENPSLLSKFVEQFMESARLEGWTPMIVLILVDGKVAGISPLKIRRQFGIRIAKFLLAPWFSPDLISEDQYRKICIARTLSFLFESLRCHLVDLTLLSESPNLKWLRKECTNDGFHFYFMHYGGRCILDIKGTWSDFEVSRGQNFRRKFKKIERQLDRAGSWRITSVDSENESSHTINRILDVERRSWKEIRRTKMDVEMDQDLMMIWNGSQYMAKAEPKFSWSACFLELDGQTLAYVLVLQYKDVAYIAKTSYDRRFRRLYPGIYVNNAAIRELFNRGQTSKIDFSTDLPFHRTWTSTCTPRVRVVIARKGTLSKLIGFGLANQRLKRILKIILGLLSERDRLMDKFIG
jgi:CelD/BcsL family acetyltransferase involved in cellulose biosynthesis